MRESEFTPIVACAAVQGRQLVPEYQNRWVLVNAANQVVLAAPAQVLDGEVDTVCTADNVHSLDHQKLQQLTISIKFGYLVLQAPQMLRLDIPMDVIEDDESAFESIDFQGQTQRAVSEGDLAAQWLSVYFGQALRLMKRID